MIDAIKLRLPYVGESKDPYYEKLHSLYLEISELHTLNGNPELGIHFIDLAFDILTKLSGP